MLCRQTTRYLPEDSTPSLVYSGTYSTLNDTGKQKVKSSMVHVQYNYQLKLSYTIVNTTMVRDSIMKILLIVLTTIIIDYRKTELKIGDEIWPEPVYKKYQYFYR